jgi:two-component system chemotaxis response regulator CheY
MAKTILVAEDSNSVRKFILLALKLAGYEVITAVDGMDALEQLPKIKIDMLITDINMPNIDGIKLVKSIRENPEYSNLPIIILSSLSTDENIEQGIAAGANSYLIKPFNDKKIQYEVSKYLSND